MNQLTPPRYRPSFTLVELLVAIAIIGTMAGMVLFSLAGARADANRTRTIGTIQKINDVLLQRWEEYRYRAVKLNVPPVWLQPTLPSLGLGGAPLLTPREGARLRMVALRDTMRMEMPDRYTDILYPPTRYTALVGGSPTYTDVPLGVGRSIPPLFNQLRNYFGWLPLGQTYTDQTLGGSYPFLPQEGGRIPATPKPIPSFENQQAELLYAIVALSNYNGGSALENFRPTEIGDTDGDTYPEFLDAWGTPIRWLRWPAGYASALNSTYSIQDTNGVPHVPDAMDPVRTDWRWPNGASQAGTALPVNVKPWTLVPLVISAGPDGQFDMVFDPADNNGNPIYVYAAETFSTAPPAYSGIAYFNVDPYFTIPPNTIGNATMLRIGSTFDNADLGTDNWSDNISSHALLME